MSRLLAVVTAAFILLIVLPDVALAWGAGVHMVTGNWILNNLTCLPPALSLALSRYPGQFLHGCLSPDIFIGKGSKAKKGHSHNWSVGLTLYNQAATAQALAYSAGYLSHLAADTVAHNIYVPQSMHLVPLGGKFSHIYLEIQADKLFTWDRELALDACTEVHSKECDALLLASTGHQNLAFRMKKRLFLKSLTLDSSKIWQRSLRLVDSLSNTDEISARTSQLIDLSRLSILSVLRERTTSPVLALDPIGAEALAGSQARIETSSSGFSDEVGEKEKPLIGNPGSFKLPPCLADLSSQELQQPFSGPDTPPFRAEP